MGCVSLPCNGGEWVVGCVSLLTFSSILSITKSSRLTADFSMFILMIFLRTYAWCVFFLLKKICSNHCWIYINKSYRLTVKSLIDIEKSLPLTDCISETKFRKAEVKCIISWCASIAVSREWPLMTYFMYEQNSK